MADKLTPKQEMFCTAYIETGNASEAYRRAYNAENSKPEVIHVRACELLKNSKIRVRVEELKQIHLERHKLTIDDIISELEEARALAAVQGIPQTSSMVTASMGKAKILGFLTDKVDTNHSGEINLNAKVHFVGADISDTE